MIAEEKFDLALMALENVVGKENFNKVLNGDHNSFISIFCTKTELRLAYDAIRNYLTKQEKEILKK